MPMQVDHARPVRTVDLKGNTISTDTGSGAPIKAVDEIGRAREPVTASDAPPTVDTTRTGAEGDDAKPPETVDPKPSEAEIRREYIAAQKERRKAAEFLRLAKAKLADAEGYAAAKALVESGEDPFALTKFAKLDPVKHYQDQTKYALSDKARDVEDPIKRELREHKERLDAYAKTLDDQQKAIKEREDLAVHNQVIAEKVIPILRDNPDKYEALSAQYGANAAVEVYRTVWEIYQQSGTARSFSEVADEMEAYWSEQIRAGIDAAAKLKRFAGRFAQSAPEPRDTRDRAETPIRSVTLSNRPSVPVAPASPPPPKKRAMTRDERVAEILKKFPD